jgi:16S rRNA (adenine1518-N6/adenine1519-N6)-dimethyltransferase
MKNIGSINATKTILTEEGFHPKKHFGQNFLVDKNILEKIVTESKITKETDVIEIGPGLGALTEFLIPQARRVLAYEIDKELMPFLRKQFSGVVNLILVNEDVLKVKLDEDIDRYFPGSQEVVVISNLPYYITTPILKFFLETTHKVAKLILMIQSEVANRVISGLENIEDGDLSIALLYRAKTNSLFTVPKTAFIPVPNVDSTVVMIDLSKEWEDLPVDEEFFFHLVHDCFVQRRKTLMNNLRQAFPEKDRSELEEWLTDCAIPLNIRADQLTVQDFIRLSNWVPKSPR